MMFKRLREVCFGVFLYLSAFSSNLVLSSDEAKGLSIPQELPRNQSSSLHFDGKHIELKLTAGGAEVEPTVLKDVYDNPTHPLLGAPAPEPGGMASESCASVPVIQDFDFPKHLILAAESISQDEGSRILNVNSFQTPSGGRIRFPSYKDFLKSTQPSRHAVSRITRHGSRTATNLTKRIGDTRWNTRPRSGTTSTPHRNVGTRWNARPGSRTTSTPHRNVGTRWNGRPGSRTTSTSHKNVDSRRTTRRGSRTTSKPSVERTPASEGVIINSEICGKRHVPRHSDFTPQVLGGSDAKRSNWPWMVNIRVQNSFGMEKFLCGGSFITPRHVIAAAHCFDRRTRNRNTVRYFVIFGSNRRNPNQSWNITKVKVEQVRIHEGYVQDVHYNDIAMLRLVRDVDFKAQISPVCLPTLEEGLLAISQQNVTVTGWGLTSFGGSSSHTLQEATMQVIPLGECRSSYIHLNRQALRQGISATMLCAGAKEGGVDACEGDSGGPLVMEVEKRWIQVGIVSFGYRCGLTDYPGVYTRVSSYMPWIRAVVNGG